VRSTVTILAAAVVGIALIAFAPRLLSRSPEPAPPRAGPHVLPHQAAATPGAQSVIGTLERYDAPTRQLTVNLGKTSMALQITGDATIRQGSHRLRAAELAAHRGVRVKLRYTEAAGQRRADWIMLAPAPRPAKPAKPAASSPTPETVK
jgi:hypothetical protein